MKKLKIGELEKIRAKVIKTKKIKESQCRAKITVHMGTCGLAAGAGDIMNCLQEEVKRLGLKDIILISSGCAGLCSREPMITIEIPGNPPVKYIDLSPEKIKKIIKDHIIQGNIVSKYALAVGSERIG